jgi:dTDP-4-dehydrorhamnose 3,5-epimerase
MMAINSGFRLGFCTLTNDAVVAYKVTYSRECDKGVQWNDPDIDIAWPENCRRTLAVC